MTSTKTSRLFSRSSWPEAQRIATLLRTETVGGGLLLFAAAAALVWANLPVQDSYRALGETVVGPAAVHLDLSLSTWAADGLLAIFFFVAGLELKREFLVGDLRDPAKAAVPIAAALCGVALPALFFTGVVLLSGDRSLLGGWAIPTATDIAFALAVLAVLGSHLPSALRSFLLTLAVVDDLVAITIIAIFYTSDLSIGMFGLALIPLLAFAALVQRRVLWWWALIPLAVVTWALVHESGIHATVAGVLLGLTVPVRTRQRGVPRVSTVAADTDVAHRLEHRLRPLSAGVAVPVFAFFAAGVSVVGDGAEAGFVEAVTSPLALAVAGALVVGKLLGVFGGTWVFARFTRAELDDDLAWSDVLGLALLAGIGFTVSLLISELAFPDEALLGEAKLAVLLGSLVAALLAAVVLRRRNAVYRRMHDAETSDRDGDGIPDAYDPEPDVPHDPTRDDAGDGAGAGAGAQASTK